MARHYLEDAEAQILGPLGELARKLDPPSLARLLGDPYRVYSYAQTVALRSAIERASGDDRAAALLAERAVALGREACRLAEPPPADWTEWVAAAEREPPPPPGPAP